MEKGLPEGGRLSPLEWCLYIADLVNNLQRYFPHISLPPPQHLIFMAIILFMDDLCLIAHSPQGLLRLIQHTQNWYERNRCLLSFSKSKVLAFFETPSQNHSRSHLTWRVMTHFPTPTYNTFNEVNFFCYIGVMLDPTLSFHNHCIMLISRIWTGLASLRDRLQSVRSPSATLLFRLWQGRVEVHLPSHLALLSQPAQTTRLQSALDLSLSFRVPPTSLTLLKLDLELPPLDLLTQAALARVHCHLQVLPPDHLAHQLFLLRTSYPPRPHSLEDTMRHALLALGWLHDWDDCSLSLAIHRRSPPHRWDRTYSRSL